MKSRVPEERKQDSGWLPLLEQDLAEMMADPCLSDGERAELLRQLELPEGEWEPAAIEGEPLSETIIKMRGER